MTAIKAITYLLDDDKAIGELIKEITLRGNDLFDLYTFTVPAEFMAALNDSVSLVILDKCIPGHDYDLYKIIDLLHSDYPGVYIIVISGYVSQQMVLDMLRRGVFDVIEKNNSWNEQLKKAFDRVTPKILFKLNAVQA